MISPTCHYDTETKTLWVILELNQIRALALAGIPSDNSADAMIGRGLLKEIDELHDQHTEKHGACEVRIIQRRYDGAPL
jgi:hypothetical protein